MFSNDNSDQSNPHSTNEIDTISLVLKVVEAHEINLD